MKSLVLLTGATGTVGSILKELFRELNIEVVYLKSSKDYKRFFLPEQEFTFEYDNVTLLHAGHPNAPRSFRKRSNYKKASYLLFKEASNRGFSIVFVSSLNVHDLNLSNYARDKRYLERQSMCLGGAVIRLGLVNSNSKLTPYFRVLNLVKILDFWHIQFLVDLNSYRVTEVRDFYDFFGDNCLSELRGVHNISSSDLIRTQIKVTNSQRLVSKILKFALFVLSRLQIGRADAMLNLMSGMRNG